MKATLRPKNTHVQKLQCHALFLLLRHDVEDCWQCRENLLENEHDTVVCKLIVQEVAMLRHICLHLRETSELSQDVVNLPGGFVVTEARPLCRELTLQHLTITSLVVRVLRSDVIGKLVVRPCTFHLASSGSTHSIVNSSVQFTVGFRFKSIKH